MRSSRKNSVTKGQRNSRKSSDKTEKDLFNDDYENSRGGLKLEIKLSSNVEQDKEDQPSGGIFDKLGKREFSEYGCNDSVEDELFEDSDDNMSRDQIPKCLTDEKNNKKKLKSDSTIIKIDEHNYDGVKIEEDDNINRNNRNFQGKSQGMKDKIREIVDRGNAIEVQENNNEIREDIIPEDILNSDDDVSDDGEDLDTGRNILLAYYEKVLFFWLINL